MGINQAKRDKTKQKIADAFMDLYAHKSYFDITIADVCKTAGIHRTTFYSHYACMDNLVRVMEDKILAEISQIVRPFYGLDLSRPDMAVIHETLTALIGYYEQHADHLLPMLAPYNDPYFDIHFRRIILSCYMTSFENSGTILNATQYYSLLCYASGLKEITYEWLKKRDVSREQLAGIFESLLEGVRSAHGMAHA